MALQCSGLAVVNNSNLSRCSSQVIHHITRGPPDSPGSLRNSKLEFYQISQSEVAGGPAGHLKPTLPAWLLQFWEEKMIISW